MSPIRMPKVDLRELEYVSEYDPHLMCPICHVPFIDPIRLNCDHVFCHSCFKEYRDHPNNTTCPSCRTEFNKYYNEWSRVPRLITNMCDDIKVRCPHAPLGCSEILARGHISHHADTQCEYRPSACPDPVCRQTLPQKYNNHEQCQHDLITCRGCSEDFLQWQMNKHVSKDCLSPPERCNECGGFDRIDGKLVHRDSCTNALVACAAMQYGCRVRLSTSLITAHEDICVFHGLAPYLQNQAEKVETLQTELAREKARSENLEGGINRLWEILTKQLAPVVDTLSQSRRNESHHGAGVDNRHHTVEAQLSNEVSAESSSAIVRAGAISPNSRSTRHLLSLHEGLRGQVDGLANQVSGLDQSLATIDARQSMTLMNETLRIREDLAHLNAGLITLRSQMNWLLNHRNAQWRGRGGSPAVTTLLDTESTVPQTSNATTLTGSTSTSGTAGGVRPQVRRSSSGHSSQERVKL